MFNKDEKSRKFHKDSDKDLLNRMIELGFVPTYMTPRRDLLMSYLSHFRSGERIFRCIQMCSPISDTSTGNVAVCVGRVQSNGDL